VVLTVLLRNPHGLWKTLSWLLPGLDFIPNKFFPAGGRGNATPFDSDKALIVANHFLETDLEKLKAAVSTGGLGTPTAPGPFLCAYLGVICLTQASLSSSSPHKRTLRRAQQLGL
jgi:hypothetical protein